MRLFPDSAVSQVEPSIFLQEEQLLPLGLASCGQACCLLFCLHQGILCPLFCPVSAPVSQQLLIKGLPIFCVLPCLWGIGVGGVGQGLVGSHSISEPVPEQYLWNLWWGLWVSLCYRPARQASRVPPVCVLCGLCLATLARPPFSLKALF